MTFPHHPTIDEIADLQEGLLPEADADAVHAHVVECEQCQEVLAALEDVSATLSAHAAEPAPIPDPVVQRVEEALATAASERAAGVPSLAEWRSPAPRGARRPHRWLLGAAAAAAAVVVLGGVLELGTPGSSSDDAGSGVSEAERDAGEGALSGGLETFAEGSDSGGSGGGSASPDPEEDPSSARVNPSQLRVAAQEFASGYTTVTKPTGSCAIVAEDLDADLVVSQFGAGSELGLMVVDEAAGTYRLVDCDTGALISKGKL